MNAFVHIQLVVGVLLAGTPAQAQSVERMAAWHHTLVSTEETCGHSYAATYVFDQPWRYMEVYVLAKLIPGTERDGTVYWADAPNLKEVQDVPGGVETFYASAAGELRTELIPLLFGRDSEEWDGLALYTVEAHPPRPVLVRCGGGALMQKSALDAVTAQAIGSEGDTGRVEGGIAFLQSAAHPLTVAVNTDGVLSIEPGDSGGVQLLIRFESGAGHVLVAYADSPERAAEFARADADVARAAVAAYYDRLLQNRIETPEPTLDAAFRSALCTLEYNWIAPYGWNECIRHWLALWHMQHTAAAEWIGQCDRSRACILTTAEHLLPDGAVPQFFPGGQTHRDFGGSNQFFAWQVGHYWQFTGDKAAIEQLAPVLDRAIRQTFIEYDPDGDLLLAWGQQIGNQEDYVSTPFNGTSPTIEGLNMLRTRGALARVLGDESTARKCDLEITLAKNRLRRSLWQGDLGRFLFYRDPQGVPRLDGQYHTLVYPVIWDVLDPLDSWTSIRHLRDRFMGEGGEAYCSNNFPNHVISTTGTQGGAAQQPWAALGLAAVGLRNETYRPLLAVARWVMDANHRGAWPEIATEPAPAYFSPPAGLFVYAVIEALFGLEVHRPEGYIQVSPSFPDAWPRAALDLAEFSAEYRREGQTLHYTVRSGEPLACRLRWALPPGGFGEVLVDGQPVACLVVPGVDCVTLYVDTAPATETTFTVKLRPLKKTGTVPRERVPERYGTKKTGTVPRERVPERHGTVPVFFPGSVAEGDTFDVEVAGCAIESIDDRCSVLSQTTITDQGTLHASVSANLLGSYRMYGRLGQLNFSRRSFFLSCRTPEGSHFWAPVDLVVLPRYEVAARGEIQPGERGVCLLVRNNTNQPLKGMAYLEAAQQTFPFSIKMAARSECETAIPIPQSVLASFSPGDNKAEVVLPGGYVVDVTLAASEVFTSPGPLAEFAKGRLVEIPLPEQTLMADTEWRNLRPWCAYGHLPWAALKPPLEGLAGQATISVEGIPHVSFRLAERKMAPVSRRINRPVLNLDLPAGAYKKLYLLVIPFLDNHDVFAPVARVTLRLGNGGFITRTLYFPGDLDWWAPEAIVGAFSTAREPRPDRFSLLPLLDIGQSDWDEGRPPGFPQPRFWSMSRAVQTPTSVINVIEIDLGCPMNVVSMSLETIGTDPALGLVAVTAEVGGPI